MLKFGGYNYLLYLCARKHEVYRTTLLSDALVSREYTKFHRNKEIYTQ